MDVLRNGASFVIDLLKNDASSYNITSLENDASFSFGYKDIT